MPENLFEQPGTTIRPSDRCLWCSRPGIYKDGTQCKHGTPPKMCKMHGRWTDLNLVARGRRAVVKCTHYGNAFVVLFADPIADDKAFGTYSIQFGMLGVGSELYTVPPQQYECPHYVYDSLVKDMRKGARPSINRIPDPVKRRTTPGQGLES